MSSLPDLLSEARRGLAAGQLDRAEAALRQVLQKMPAHAEALRLHGFVLKLRGDLDQAERSFARALEVEPRHIDAHLQLGNLRFARNPDDGLALFERAIEIDPTHAGARSCLTLGHVAMGALYSAREQWPEMFTAYERAIELEPSHAGAHFNLAIELLRHGRFLDGWREYEWRWQWKGFADRPRGFSQPLWRGETLAGARILLHGEQGLGDVLQFSRYAPLVSERGGTVVLEVPRDLIRLLAPLPGVTELVARGDSLPAFEWQCPLMSLPFAFGTVVGTSVESIPARVPYVTTAAAPLPSPSSSPETPSLRIGLVWAGSPTHLKNRRRSMPLELFAPLTHIEGTTWYSLQKGDAAASLRSALPDLAVVDLGPHIGDFADTAALVASLDLVITVDTSVAHLAGAMNTPVWILLSTPADWRWMLNRTDSPWYPSARLFRQAKEGQWATVIDEVRRALIALLGNGLPQGSSPASRHG